MAAFEYDTGCASIPAAVNLVEAQRFLDFMAEGEPVTFQTFDDTDEKRPYLKWVTHDDIRHCGELLAGGNELGAGIFWMVNHGDGLGRKAANVTAVRCVFLDLDGAPLEPVLAAGVEPHAVIESSPGKWHVYWQVTGCSLEQFKPAQTALAAKFNGDKSVHDLPRVLRVPGFLHRKGEPFTVRIESLAPIQPYELDTLVKRLGLDLKTESPPKVVRVDPDTGEITDKITPGGRHAHLVKHAAQMNWRGMTPEGTRAELHAVNGRDCEPPKSDAEVDAIVTDILRRYADEHGRDPKRVRIAAGDGAINDGPPVAPDVPVQLFRDVDLSQLATHVPALQEWWWDGYMPAGHVTLLGGHGGAGKSTFALMLAASMAVGRDFLGPADEAGACSLLQRRGSRVVGDATPRQDLQEVGARPRAGPAEPAHHRRDRLRPGAVHRTAHRWRAGRRDDADLSGAGRIRRAAHQIDVLIADNASDVFDGEEMNRAMVRGFIRSLARLVRQRNGAALLLSHVDKATSRGGPYAANSESYSGSTAWHNSVRSRLFLKDCENGRLELQHQKSNLGQKQEPLQLKWPPGELPQLTSGIAMQEGVDLARDLLAPGFTHALLTLIHEYAGRGEFVATASTSPSNAARLFAAEKSFPRGLKRAEVFPLLRDAERAGLLEREDYRSPGRKDLQRWALTTRGRESIGVVPTAPTAPAFDVGADGTASAEGVRQPRQPAVGGMGGGARAQKSAQSNKEEGAP